MIPKVFEWSPKAALGYAAVLIALIAVAHWRMEINATLGFLYIFPLVGTVLGWRQLIIAARGSSNLISAERQLMLF